MDWRDEVNYGTWVLAGLIVIGLLIAYTGTALGVW